MTQTPKEYLRPGLTIFEISFSIPCQFAERFETKTQVLPGWDSSEAKLTFASPLFLQLSRFSDSKEETSPEGVTDSEKTEGAIAV
nr:hypothetical protein [Cellulosilyticum ruminicola]